MRFSYLISDSISINQPVNAFKCNQNTITGGGFRLRLIWYQTVTETQTAIGSTCLMCGDCQTLSPSPRSPADVDSYLATTGSLTDTLHQPLITPHSADMEQDILCNLLSMEEEADMMIVLWWPPPDVSRVSGSVYTTHESVHSAAATALQPVLAQPASAFSVMSPASGNCSSLIVMMSMSSICSLW